MNGKKDQQRKRKWGSATRAFCVRHLLFLRAGLVLATALAVTICMCMNTITESGTATKSNPTATSRAAGTLFHPHLHGILTLQTVLCCNYKCLPLISKTPSGGLVSETAGLPVWHVAGHGTGCRNTNHEGWFSTCFHKVSCGETWRRFFLRKCSVTRQTTTPEKARTVQKLKSCLHGVLDLWPGIDVLDAELFYVILWGLD